MEEERTAVAQTLPQETESITYARQAWRQLGGRLRSVTPSQLGRGALIVLGTGLLVWLVGVSWPALAPFILGAVIAYVLLPLVNWLDKFLPRSLAVLLTLAAVLAVIGAFLAQFLPLIGGQLSIVYNSIPDAAELEDFEVELLAQLETLPDPVRRTVQNILVTAVETSQEKLDAFVITSVNRGLTGLIGLANTIGFVLGFLVIPAWLLDVLRDQQSGRESTNRLLPDWLQPDFWALMQLVDRPFRAFLQGQFVLAVAAGIGMVAGLSLLEIVGFAQFQYKTLIGIIVFFFQLIPTVGPIVGAVVLFMLGLTRSPQIAIAALILYIVVQQLVNAYVAPHVERRYVGIHPAFLVMAIVLLSELGLIWVMLAAPLTAVVRDLFRYVYGRVNDPPRPAGVLPGEPIPILPHSQLFSPFIPREKRVPVAYKRGRTRIRRPNRMNRTSSINETR